jgi:hypothetical protein
MHKIKTSNEYLIVKKMLKIYSLNFVCTFNFLYLTDI